MECNGCRWYRVEFDEIDRYPDDAEGYGRVPMRQWPEKTNYCPNCGSRVTDWDGRKVVE